MAHQLWGPISRKIESQRICVGYRHLPLMVKEFNTGPSHIQDIAGLHSSQHDLLLHLVGRQVHPRDLEKGNDSNSVKQIITLIEASTLAGSPYPDVLRSV